MLSVSLRVASSADLIIGVVDGERCHPAEADVARGTGVLDEPEAVNLSPRGIDLRVLDPEGRRFCGLAFEAGQREIMGIDPHFAVIQEFVSLSGCTSSR